jgi:hypothetical protein
MWKKYDNVTRTIKSFTTFSGINTSTRTYHIHTSKHPFFNKLYIIQWKINIPIYLR